MKKSTIFDRYGHINDSRRNFLNKLLGELIDTYSLKTALDIGCGVGFFSDFLSSMNLDVTSFDARADNIEEARKRYPNIQFYIYNVEDQNVQEFKPFDMVLCLGLLYHLENPFRAIRNLYAVTNQILIIESRIFSHKLAMAALVDEEQKEDQALNYIAFVPSEACFIKMLYKAGFLAVYKPYKLPDHDDFRETLKFNRQRTILIASKVKLNLPTLQLVSESKNLTHRSLSKKKWLHKAMRIVRFLKTI